MVFDPENVRSPMHPGNLYDAKGSSMARANSFRQSSSDHFIGSLKRFHRQMKLERSFHHRKSTGIRNWSELFDEKFYYRKYL